jgi:hypothetical protein
MCEMTQSHVARGILEYLRRHPEAQDTVAGIAEWWLPEEKIQTRTRTVEEALAELVARNLVIGRTSTDSQIHYRINVTKLAEIEAILENRGK